MTEPSGEMKELYGRTLDGKLVVLTGRLVKKEVKQEEERQKSSGEGIEKGKMAKDDAGNGNEANSMSSLALHGQLHSADVIIHPQIDQPQQMSVLMEDGLATTNGGDSLADELQQLRAMVVENERSLKGKELLNSALTAKLEEVRKEKKAREQQLMSEISLREETSRQCAELERRLVEEQQKNARLIEESLAKEKPNNMDTETDMTMVHSVDKETSTTLQPSRAVVAAQLLGINAHQLDEPQSNELKERLEQLNGKYLKVKRLFRTEQKAAAKLRQKLKDKEKELSGITTQLGDAGPDKPIDSPAEAASSPVEQIQLTAQMRQRLLSEQMDFELPEVEEAEAGREGGMQDANEDGAVNNVVNVVNGVFKCSKCRKPLAFSTAQLLASHHRHFHSDRQHHWRHQCQQCGRRCPSNAHLVMHMRTHTGEKPHKCRECGREFAEKAKLTRHELVHTGARPYVCTVCQRAFTTQSNRDRHFLSLLTEKLEQVTKEKQAAEQQWTAEINGIRNENSQQLTQLESQLIEEQQKSAQLAKELMLEKKKSKEVASSLDKATATNDQSAAIAAQLLGIDRQLLVEPRNEFKEKFDESEFNLRQMRNAYDALMKDYRQEQSKSSNLKQLYKAEKEIAAELREKLKEKEILYANEEELLLGMDDRQPMEESTGPMITSPLDAEPVDDETPPETMEERGDNGPMQTEENSRIRLITTSTTRPTASAIAGRGRERQRKVADGKRRKAVRTKQAKKSVAANVPTGGVFKCATCADHVAFSTAQLLAKHEQRFHGDRQHWRHECPECGRRCKSKGSLQIHLRTHTGEKPHKCQWCGRCFAVKGNLVAHKRVHTGERPYVCAICQKAFRERGGLDVHKRVHSGAAPYSCPHCAKHINDPSNYRRHEKICQQQHAGVGE